MGHIAYNPTNYLNCSEIMVTNIIKKLIDKKRIASIVICSFVFIFQCNTAIGKPTASMANSLPQEPFHFCKANNSPTFEVAFSPNQGATKLIISTIKEAKKNIYVAAFALTSQSIADALVDAQKNGVEVRVILDKKQNKDAHSKSDLLRKKRIKVRISNRSLMHNKYMIIDGNTLQLGSFNYSMSAENKNAENVLVIHNSPDLVGLYLNEWQKLWDKAK